MYDVIIIGAGPAGMTASIYASRANMNTLMLDRGAPGGQLMNTNEIENYPGYKTISGPELAINMFEHAQSFGSEIKYTTVNNLVKQPDGTWLVETETENYEARSVIIATGTRYKKLGIPGEEKFTGAGVSWCAVCDGAFYRGKEVVVVGGGDSAVEEAMYLTKFASKVTLVHRRSTFRAQQILVDRLKRNDKINIIYDSVVEEIYGDHTVESVVIRNVKTDEVTIMHTSGVFEYVGMNPVTEFVSDFDILDEEGWIITNEKMETGISGLYAVGDVRKDAVRQVVVATGEGCVAAIRAQHYVESFFNKYN